MSLSSCTAAHSHPANRPSYPLCHLCKAPDEGAPSEAHYPVPSATGTWMRKCSSSKLSSKAVLQKLSFSKLFSKIVIGNKKPLCFCSVSVSNRSSLACADSTQRQLAVASKARVDDVELFLAELVGLEEVEQRLVLQVTSVLQNRRSHFSCSRLQSDCTRVMRAHEWEGFKDLGGEGVQYCIGLFLRTAAILRPTKSRQRPLAAQVHLLALVLDGNIATRELRLWRDACAAVSPSVAIYSKPNAYYVRAPRPTPAPLGLCSAW
eukprot:SAG11_NODE_5438_length_1560_cov_1.119097_1_plen_263_part_00